MRSELQALKQPAVLPLALADASKAMTKSCAKCHMSNVSERHGGGLTLFNESGLLLPMSDADKRRVVNRVTRNSMPPAPAKLAAADKKLIVDAFQGK